MTRVCYLLRHKHGSMMFARLHRIDVAGVDQRYASKKQIPVQVEKSLWSECCCKFLQHSICCIHTCKRQIGKNERYAVQNSRDKNNMQI